MTQAVADPENFGGGGFEAKTSNIRMSSPKLRVIFRPKSEIQTFFSPKIRWSPKKKKKKVFTKIETDFSAEFVTFRSVGGDASRNGAELFKIRADFSAKIVTFRLVGGMHPPVPPPKSATGHRYQCGVKELIMFIARANAEIKQTMYQMIYPSESNSERFNLFLCHVFAMYQRCSISASFE